MLIDIIIYASQYKEKGSLGKLDDELKELPDQLRNKFNSFRRKQDAYLFLLGKLLLIKAANDLGISNYSLDLLSYNDYQKPYSNMGFYFNISHSGEYCLCAVNPFREIGADIEKIKEINLSDFRKIWSERELNSINNDDNPVDKFYHYWTRKEAVIKAEGKGMSNKLSMIDTFQNEVKLCGSTFDLRSFNLVKGYDSAVAIRDARIGLIQFRHVDYYNELE